MLLRSFVLFVKALVVTSYVQGKEYIVRVKAGFGLLGGRTDEK